ncbi:uncharacterized protein LOC119399581 [Rhipicephalus sanguineus]|uniref:Secreted protein n=1 Tax=Rhipicephalus sanguineus TaxID=34632 RepID=A0A9D4PGC1_RHISA|nr:uncharacterized protein LOC119399581 [Rhipicephalus sanguineus]KAH7942736.1 hypothetical protein HPB52_000685 [Rhipicephalus sanguineus]
MRLSTLVAAAFLALLVAQTTDGFLTSLALLPISAITSIGGIAGLKLAMAMKILDMLGWFKVSRYGIGLRAGIESSKLPDRVVPRPKPQGIFSGPTISVPIAALPYFVGGGLQKPLSVRLPIKDFKMLANATTDFDSPKVKFSSSGSASVNGNKGSMLQASSALKSPFVNLEGKHAATIRGRRSIEADPKVIKDAVNLVRELDTNRCILRLSCEVSADASAYGSYGRRVASFMRSLGPVGKDSAFVDFEKAYHRGRSSGLPACIQTYSSCKVDLRALVAFVQST